MKYPIVMQKGKDFYVPYVPDFDIRTQGRTEDEAVNMAVDAVCMVGLCYRENGMRLPEPTPLEEIEVEDGESTMLVEIDLETYQRRCEEERGQLAG